MRFMKTLLAITLFVVSSSQSHHASALGQEEFGNKPKRDANYQTWPGILGVINDKHRVYRWWVNGNEKFYFVGDTAALNDALTQFSETEFPQLEVVLRPAPGKASTFSGEKTVDFNWELHLVGGIAAGMRRQHLGEKIWVAHPVLTVYVGGNIELSKLKIPANVTVSQIADLQKRYAEALGSESKTVRGWVCGSIASLDPYNSAAMYRVAKMLIDEDPWVRGNAVSALKSYGAEAKPAIKHLQSASDSGDERMKQRIAAAISEIESATLDEKAKSAHVAMVKEIAMFVSKQDSGK